MTQISASLASAPLDRLGEALAELEAGGADLIHFDVEDGSFVPVMTLGTKIIYDLRPLSSKPFDVHLMMVNPEWIIPALAAGGANRISVHFEACPYPRRTLRLIHELGLQAGLAFNPATPLPDLSYLRPYLSFVVILTSEPEIPDAPYLDEAAAKVREGKTNPALAGVEWVIDGGINPGTIQRAAVWGADTFVIGRALFRGQAVAENIRQLRTLIDSNQD